MKSSRHGIAYPYQIGGAVPCRADVIFVLEEKKGVSHENNNWQTLFIDAKGYPKANSRAGRAGCLGAGCFGFEFVFRPAAIGLEKNDTAGPDLRFGDCWARNFSSTKVFRNQDRLDFHNSLGGVLPCDVRSPRDCGSSGKNPSITDGSDLRIFSVDYHIDVAEIALNSATDTAIFCLVNSLPT